MSGAEARHDVAPDVDEDLDGGLKTAQSCVDVAVVCDELLQGRLRQRSQSRDGFREMGELRLDLLGAHLAPRASRRRRPSSATCIAMSWVGFQSRYSENVRASKSNRSAGSASHTNRPSRRMR